MYACKKCGFIHEGKTERERVDRDEHTGGRMGCKVCNHGWATYRICPECGYKESIKWEKDKNHPHNIAYENYFKVMDYKRKLEKEAEKEIEKKVKEYEKSLK